jgi:selenobiotic family peptide radical SAM maturase
MTKSVDEIYPICQRILGDNAWVQLRKTHACYSVNLSLPDFLDNPKNRLLLPDYFAELAKLEYLYYQIKNIKQIHPVTKIFLQLNPSLQIQQTSWKFSSLFNTKIINLPIEEQEWILIWKHPRTLKTHFESADENDLLIIKLIAEDIAEKDVISSGEITIGKLHELSRRAIRKGILIGPASDIKRTETKFPITTNIPRELKVVSSFTLQWHITHKCELHCKHCYDRSKKSPLTLEQGIRVLDDLADFCQLQNVSGHVCFTGGNPFLYPNFFELYQVAADHGFSTSILGNPISRKKIEQLINIKHPGYFQTSLEGLPNHNDMIRGKGHFAHVIEFLGVLRDYDISSTIMLTLTKDNFNQVLQLAERLRGHCNTFTFNRLSQVGEGKNLSLPTKDEYVDFLTMYVNASKNNPIISYKDNLINIILNNYKEDLFEGCTGYGCGAAFNFIAILPDGEAHACRKFPSPIGNIIEQSLADVFDSELAQKYRDGTSACKGCSLHPYCGGCMAVTYSCGSDVFKNLDPYCFMNDNSKITQINNP